MVLENPTVFIFFHRAASCFFQMNFILSKILENTLVDFNLSSTLGARDARLAGLDRARFAIIAKSPTRWTAAIFSTAEI